MYTYHRNGNPLLFFVPSDCDGVQKLQFDSQVLTLFTFNDMFCKINGLKLHLVASDGIESRHSNKEPESQRVSNRESKKRD